MQYAVRLFTLQTNLEVCYVFSYIWDNENSAAIEIRDALTYAFILYCNKEHVINFVFVLKLLTFSSKKKTDVIDRTAPLNPHDFVTQIIIPGDFVDLFRRSCFDAMYAPHKPL